MDLLGLLSPEATAVLANLPWEDRRRGERLLRRLGERAGSPPEAVPLLEAVLAALPDVPDAEMALLNLERWASMLATPRATLPLLLEAPRLLADLLAVLGASQYLADILARDPWLYTLLLENDGPHGAADYQREASALASLRSPEARRDALRRLKRRAYLRIGWRDLARRAPLEETIREISDLADVLVGEALALAREELAPRFPTAAAAVRFAVMAMGKLGARELNYSSDIDLVFVMDSATPQDEAHRRYAQRLSETLISVLSQETGEGRCFRVDMRLRPEGRFGALVRSYGAFRTYYDRWAETWERQALIKARPIAGDPELGERFMRLVEPVVYRRIQGVSLLEDVREMRSAVERKLSAAGEMETHVKEGRGTIRDVEFTLQLLQLLFGADHPEIRAADTLTALARLERAEVLTAEERAVFERGYRFFREVEHRLQLMNDLPVRVIPSEAAALRRLARSIGFAGEAAFTEAYREISDGVRGLVEAIHTRLGTSGGSGDELRTALLAADIPEGEEVLRRHLARCGFPEPDAATRALVRLASGPSGYPHPSPTRRLFADLAPRLLEAFAAAADPTWALEGLADLADRKLLHRALYQTLLDQPDTVSALARIAGAAPAAMRLVLRYPELSDLVTDPDQVMRRKDAPTLADELEERLVPAHDETAALSVLRRFKLREFVRLAGRHVLAPMPAEVETAEWSDLADVLVRAALRLVLGRLRKAGRWPRDDEAGFAVIALGRHGGRDLHFASDLDLLYLFGGDDALPQQQYEHLARELSSVLQTVTGEGKLFDLDLRLRPEGRQGFTVSRLDAMRRYYAEEGRAETWELQMLTRARPIAGSPETGRRFLELVEPRVYRSPMPEGWTAEIAAMKRRIERERVSAGDRERHLKLGPGGLSDVEFLVQYLQLRHGGAHPEVRVPSTLEALTAMSVTGVLTLAEVEVLTEGYRHLTGLRQSLTLLRPDGPTDLLPDPTTEPRLARALARTAGFETAEALAAHYRQVTLPVRQLLLRWLG